MIGKQITKTVNYRLQSIEMACRYNVNKALFCDKGDWYEVVGWHEPTLEEVRAAKQAEWNMAYTPSSENHADGKAKRHFPPLETVPFCACDHSFHVITPDQLTTMKPEFRANAQARCQRKRTLQERIISAETMEALDAIVFDFGQGEE